MSVCSLPDRKLGGKLIQLATLLRAVLNEYLPNCMYLQQ